MKIKLLIALTTALITGCGPIPEPTINHDADKVEVEDPEVTVTGIPDAIAISGIPDDIDIKTKSIIVTSGGWK